MKDIKSIQNFLSDDSDADEEELEHETRPYRDAQQDVYTCNGKFPTCWGCAFGFTHDPENKPINTKMYQMYKEQRRNMNDIELSNQLYELMKEEHRIINKPVPNWPPESIYNHITRHMSDAFSRKHDSLSTIMTTIALIKDNMFTKKNKIDIEYAKAYLLFVNKESAVLKELETIL
jgi:hypothetical protein